MGKDQQLHKCSMSKKKTELKKLPWIEKIRMIDFENPLSKDFFRSEESIRDEQRRHLRTNKHMIHPLSKFRAWYDIFLVFLYFTALIIKAVDFGFLSSRFKKANPVYYVLIVAVDPLCWVDILMTFFTGFQPKAEKRVELRLRVIAKHYVFGPYFVCDMISSFPKVLLMRFVYNRSLFSHRIIATLVAIMTLFKSVRVVTLLKCVRRSARYLGVKTKAALDLSVTLVLTFFIVHWLACLQFGIPRIIRRTLPLVKSDKVWYIKAGLYKAPFLKQYLHGFFRSSAHILSIRLDLYDISLPEEYVVNIFAFMIGKVLVGFIWIVLALAILKSRSIELKFTERMNQLEEYMKQKRVPMILRGKIFKYYNYKFQGKFFKEHLVSSLLSSRLKTEVDWQVCQSFLKKVPLFGEMDTAEVRAVVRHLVPEIFMPHDVIIRSGSLGDSMYFVSSGTVALYSRSGRELAHLQDGAYFGEMSLVLPNEPRQINVVALETTYVYKLKRKHFEKCLLTNKEVYTKIKTNAKKRIEQITKLDDEYQKMLFGQTYRGISEPKK